MKQAAISRVLCAVGFALLLAGCGTSSFNRDGYASGKSAKVVFSKANATDRDITKSDADSSIRTDPVTTASVQAPAVSRPSTGISDAYAHIAEATNNTRGFAEEATIRSSEQKLAAHKYSLFPQITPNASVNHEGEPVAQLQVEQVLYDSGRYSATRQALLGEQAQTKADLDIQRNSRIAEAILTYIDFHYAQDAAAVSARTAELFERFGKQAQSRIEDGLGDVSERDLFELKLLEAQADQQNFDQQAQTNQRKLRRLADIDMPDQKPARFAGDFAHELAPSVRKAAAEKDYAAAGVALEKAQWLPIVALGGSIGMDRHGFETDTAEGRVNVSVSKPLSWGLGSSLKASKSELEASRLRYDETLRDVSDRLALLQLEIDHASNKIERLAKVAEASEVRLNRFEDQFLTGSASLVEVVGLVETYKKSKMNLVEAHYDILRSELEMAQIAGVLHTGNP
ncbi:MAG: TolC family protein [Ahrensia sp.]